MFFLIILFSREGCAGVRGKPKGVVLHEVGEKKKTILTKKNFQADCEGQTGI